MEPSPSAVGLVSVTRQRLVGLLVLVVVAVASLVVAQLLHPPITGNASRGSIPDPPAVGDCLLDPTVIGPQPQTSSATSSPFPWLRTGPCQGRRFGEVTAVVTPHLPPAPSQPPGTASVVPSSGTTGGDNRAAPPMNPYYVSCVQAVGSWLGLPAFDGKPPSDGRWTPDQSMVDVLVSGPSQVQRASGQQWAACIAVVADAAPGGTPVVGFDSSTRGTFDPGPALPVLAYCAPADNTDQQLPCTTRHTAERFGFTLKAPNSAVTEQDRRGCGALIQRLTGMPDLTAGGRLTLTVVDSRSQIEDQHVWACLLVTVGPHHLTGPLLGLQNRPAPLT